MNPAPSDRIERLRARLQAALTPTSIEIIDDSHKHVGHAGARDGRGHFSVCVVAERFRGLRALARHRLMYDAAGDLFDTDIHALSIKALTPEEAA
jgi:BolA protein